MKQRLFCLCSLLLCALLLFAACSPGGDVSSAGTSASASGEAPVRERRTVPFGQMTYTRPDIDTTKARLTRLAEELEAAEDFETATALNDECEQLLADFTTMYTLATIHNYLDQNDAFFEEEVRVLGQAGVDLSLLYTTFKGGLVEGPFAGPYRGLVGDYVFESEKLDLLFASPEVTELAKQRRELEVDYNKSITTLTTTVEGKAYTFADIAALSASTQQLQLMNAYFTQHVSTFAQLYGELVRIDKETAFKLGFEDAATMYYLQYRRDYAPKDARTFCDVIKSDFTPLLAQLPAGQGTESLSFSKATAQMPQALEALSGEFAPAWQFMQDNGLYSCEAADGKWNGAFTVNISSYDAPFLFLNWDDSRRSFSTLVHEFGHFHDFWLHYADNSIPTLDVTEIYSTALELLMLPQYELFFDDAETARLQTLRDFATNTIVYQAMLEDFQLLLYDLDSFDATVAGRLYADLLEEYGLGNDSLRDPAGANNSWLAVSHLFANPFYTASYVASGAAALQLWQLPASEGAAAYFGLLAADQNQTYTALLQGAGLRSITDASVLKTGAAALEDAFHLENAEIPAASDASGEETEVPDPSQTDTGPSSADSASTSDLAPAA